ncbi:MAG TPA: hypothetical protein VFR81_25415 [Longimicrobium sp.]|nr:hypothetical protein [Longimicrobium sp.]
MEGDDLALLEREAEMVIGNADRISAATRIEAERIRWYGENLLRAAARAREAGGAVSAG